MTSELGKESAKSETIKDEAEQAILQIQKKLTEAFDVFDGDKTKTIDAKEMPTVIYSLNLVPTQGEIRDLITEVNNTHLNLKYSIFILQ